MVKHLPKKYSSGYTILEIIVAVFILVILFSAVSAGYRQYILKRNLDSVKSQIISDIKLAQEYAIAGKKPPDCDVLNGYIFSTFITGNRYTLTADCTNDQIVKTVETSKLATGINIQSDIVVIFKTMGMGTNIPVGSNRVITLGQQTTGTTRTITITPGGEVR
jgi:Tfp pilus assembly protein PilE